MVGIGERPGSPAPKVHLLDFTIQRQRYGRCGRPCPKERATKERGRVTCSDCRRRAEEDYACQRDGIDYRNRRWEEQRRLQADRTKARSIVAARHQDEYETELALLRLARPW